VKVLGVYNREIVSDNGSQILQELTDLSLLKAGSLARVNRHDKLSGHFTEDAAKES
jgi:hypothetical protein